MKRREFLKTAAVAPLAVNIPGIARDMKSGKLEKRPLGKTGEKLSILGFGGIVVMNATPKQASYRVDEAIDYGVNYFDVAPSYGNAELKLGPALKKHRSNVFLACKTTERTKEGARKELEQSLRQLQTDHFDLYQLHAVTRLEEVETIFSKDGAMETFLAARKEGKIRFIGFSAHSVEAALALLDRFPFDSILFPINYTSWYNGNFGPQVVAKAQKNGAGILALKSMARGPLPKGKKKIVEKCWYEPLTTPEEANVGLRFTLSQPVTAAIPPGDENLFKMALDLAKKFTPFQLSELETVKQKALAQSPIFKYPMS